MTEADCLLAAMVVVVVGSERSMRRALVNGERRKQTNGMNAAMRWHRPPTQPPLTATTCPIGPAGLNCTPNHQIKQFTSDRRSLSVHVRRKD